MRASDKKSLITRSLVRQRFPIRSQHIIRSRQNNYENLHEALNHQANTRPSASVYIQVEISLLQCLPLPTSRPPAKPPFLNMVENRREVNSRWCITLESREGYTSFFCGKETHFYIDLFAISRQLQEWRS